MLAAAYPPASIAADDDRLVAWSKPRSRPRGVPRWRAALLGASRLGLFMPLSGAGAMSFYSLLLRGRVSASLTLVSWLFIYASYRIDHLAEVGRFDAKLASARSTSLGRRPLHLALLGAALLGAFVVTGLCGGTAALAGLALFPVSVALYGTPLLGWLTGGRLGVARVKDVPYMKSFYTAFFWGLLALFGAVYLDAPRAPAAVFFFLWMAGRVFLNTVFCDLKDLERDRAEGVVTLALRLGRRGTLRLLHDVNLGTLLLLLAAVAAGVLPPWALALALTGLYADRLLARAARPGADIQYLCDVVADAEFLFWLPAAGLGLALSALGAGLLGGAP